MGALHRTKCRNVPSESKEAYVFGYLRNIKYVTDIQN